jgi:hypothetical protein
MRLLKERIPAVAKSVVDALLEAELIEVAPENRGEVELDVESVLKEYRRMDHELTEKARDMVANRQLDYSQTFKIKQKLAQDAGFGLNDDGIQWLCDQIVELLMQSRHVDEVFGEDHELRSKTAPVLKKELHVESDLDKQVRARIRNLQEGTADFEVEYKKTMEQLRAARKLEDR